MDWVALKSRITNHRLNSITWTSEQHSLLEIYNRTEEWGIDSTRAALAPLSNLRTAVAECKRVISIGARSRLADIFYLCATKTNVELQLALNIPRRENAMIERTDGGVKLVLTPEQYERIQRKTRLQIHFTEVSHHI
jgi:hypothetical protein